MNERLSLTGTDSAPIDRLADAAAKSPVPRGPDADAVLREALFVGRARARSRAARRSWVRAGAAAAVVVAALAWLGWPEWPEGQPIPPAGRLELAAFGHRIEALDGARIDAVEVDPERALWRLEAGAALFDVAPSSRRFEVQTPDATVTVHGTVFAVTVADEGTHVEVYEGRVEVRDRRGTRLLEPGESYATRAGLRTPPRLAARAERAAERRALAAAASSVEGDEHADLHADLGADDRADHATEPRVELAPAEPEDAPSGPSATESPRRGPPAARPVDLAGVRELCARGEWARALQAIGEARPPRSESGEWALLEGDAHRALGRSEAAARAYERAAESLTPTRAALAGFLAAAQHERGRRPEAALTVLDRTHAADRGSPVEERALAMRASLLARVGRTTEARTSARAYLAAFPSGAAIPEMERLAGSP